MTLPDRAKRFYGHLRGLIRDSASDPPRTSATAGRKAEDWPEGKLSTMPSQGERESTKERFYNIISSLGEFPRKEKLYYNYARTRKASPSRGKGLAESRQRSRRVTAKVSPSRGRGKAACLCPLSDVLCPWVRPRSMATRTQVLRCFGRSGGPVLMFSHTTTLKGGV